MALTASKAFCSGSSAKLASKSSRASTVRMPVVVRAQAGEQSAEVVRCRACRRSGDDVAGLFPYAVQLLCQMPAADYDIYVQQFSCITQRRRAVCQFLKQLQCFQGHLSVVGQSSG